MSTDDGQEFHDDPNEQRYQDLRAVLLRQLEDSDYEKAEETANRLLTFRPRDEPLRRLALAIRGRHRTMTLILLGGAACGALAGILLGLLVHFALLPLFGVTGTISLDPATWLPNGSGTSEGPEPPRGLGNLVLLFPVVGVAAGWGLACLYLIRWRPKLRLE